MPRLALFDSQWKHGGFGGLNPDDPNNKLSSFQAMDRILLELTKTCPRLRRVTLIGHSAGTQFVDRYSVLSSIAAATPKVAFRFVALAPSSVLYPSELRPHVTTNGTLSFSTPAGSRACNAYPYGLDTSPLFARLVRNPAADRAGSSRSCLIAISCLPSAPRTQHEPVSTVAIPPTPKDRIAT